MTSEQICAIISDIFPFSLFGSFAPYVFFAFIFLLFFLFIKLHLAFKKKRKMAVEWENFALACKRKDFDDDEHRTAVMLLKSASIKTSPMKFLSSSEVFEQVVADVLKKIKTAKVPDQKGLIFILKNIRTKLRFDGRKGEPLKSTREIRGGQQITIMLPGLDSPRHGVVSNNDDACLRIMLDCPLEEEFRQDNAMNASASFVVDNDARYHFSAQVAGAGSSYIAFEHPEKIAREQNREHFRYNLDISLRILRSTAEDEETFTGTRPDFEEAAAKDIINAQSINISGGGICVATNEELNIGERMYINFQLGGRQYNIPGEITDKKPGNYAGTHYGIEFIDLSNTERESIITHINTRERTAVARRNQTKK